jgi:CDK inhibitor PHO81
MLPESRFDLSVAEVTLAQFEALAKTLGRNLDLPIKTSVLDWHTVVSQSMISLVQLMQVRHD